MRVGLGSLVTVLVSAWLAGCADLGTDSSNAMPMLGRTSLVHTADPSFDPQPGQFYAWLPEAGRVYSDERIPADGVEAVVRTALRQELGRRGYRYTTSTDAAAFLVGYTVALESALDDQAIAAKYGLQPGLVASGVDNARYEKGTLIVYLVDPVRRHVVWRSALQGLTVLDLPPEMREPRIREAVGQTMSKLP